MARSSAGLSSLQRAVQLLEAFDTGVRDLSATEISSRTGTPPSTTHRILKELASLGLLERTPDRRYRIGLRLWELAVRTPGALGVREIGMPVLRTAHAALGQHLQLGILEGTEVLHLERLSAPHSTVNYTVVGGRMPFHSTSSGLVLAAFASPDTQESLLSSPQPAFKNTPVLSPTQMRARLAEVRRSGYATTPGYIDPSATAIAVPILSPSGVAIAAVAAVVPTEAPHEQHVLSVIRPAAHAIGRAMAQRYSGY